MGAHLPPSHPELAFYRHWLAKALRRQADAGGAAGKQQKALRARAARVDAQAADGLAVAYGADHPTVKLWRGGGDDGWLVGE